MKHQIKDICAKNLTQDWLGDGDYLVNFLSGLRFVDSQTISFYKGEDINRLSEIEAGILIVKQSLKNQIFSYKSKCLIFTPDPMSLFADIVNENFSDDFSDSTIDKFEHKSISSNAYIETNVKIGSGTKIFPNASLYDGTTIGNNCMIQTGAVLGGNGMTYIESENEYKRMVQIGKVIVEDDVVIGCNTVVLKGILEYTKIGKGSKIGNLVNVGHNSVIGNDCYISSSVIIGGATVIGNNCWIAPGVSIRDNLKIGDNCTIGVGSVVVKDIEPNSVYYGNPAKFIKLKQ